MLAPILLFTYNRPVHTQKTIEALQKNEFANESELFIFSDGWKSEEDKAKVHRVRNYLHTIKGFKKIHIEAHKQNYGLARNIIESVTKIINKYGKVIVLEDDLITSRSFLSFMNEALNRFKHDEKIGHVHAFCYSQINVPETFFIKWTGSWGWGTWKNAWDCFNPNGSALLHQLETKKLTRTFDFNGSYPYTRMLRRQITGENNSWAIRWNASLFLADKLSLNAGKSLVENIGFDGSGVHCGSQNIYKANLTDIHLHIPEKIAIKENENARKEFEKFYRKTNSFQAKAIRRIKGLFDIK